MTHSGRQFGGAPNIPETQAQMARSSWTRHTEFGPQGLGTHGLTTTGGSRGRSTHRSNGSPSGNSGGQLQIGLWLTIWHRALSPHVPGQGSTHFLLMQARFRGHSALATHSGRQLGGTPMYPSKQEHVGRSPVTRHTLFGPHGDGMHGLTGFGASIGFKRHPLNASPTYPGSQAQIGMWLLMVQTALGPHTPGHGSRQCWLMHPK